MSKLRKAVIALAVTAAGVAGVATYEGYTDKAVIPVPGDVPTLGHGTTRWPDGTPVRLGDTTNPRQAAELLRRDMAKFEGAIKSCVKVPLTQNEYNAYLSLSYNIGQTAFCNSTLVKKLNAEDYEGACRQIMEYQCGPAPVSLAAKKGEQCYSKDGRPRMVIKGLVNRRNSEFKTCMAG